MRRKDDRDFSPNRAASGRTYFEHVTIMLSSSTAGQPFFETGLLHFLHKQYFSRSGECKRRRKSFCPSPGIVAGGVIVSTVAKMSTTGTRTRSQPSQYSRSGSAALSGGQSERCTHNRSLRRGDVCHPKHRLGLFSSRKNIYSNSIDNKRICEFNMHAIAFEQSTSCRNPFHSRHCALVRQLFYPYNRRNDQTKRVPSPRAAAELGFQST